METLKQPYELLVRWDKSGHIAGAHVQYRYITREAGAVVGEFVSGAEPVDVAAEFPLQDLLNRAATDALSTTMKKEAEMEAQARAHEAEMQAVKSAHREHAQTLHAEIAALKTALKEWEKAAREKPSGPAS